MPIRLTLITLEKISRSCGPCLETVRCAQPMPAQQTEIRSSPDSARRVDRGLDLLGLEHVRLDERAPSPSSSASASPFSAFRSAIVTDAPARAQSPRGRLAEPGGPADDQRALALDPHRRGSLAVRRRHPLVRARDRAVWVASRDRADRAGQSEPADRRPPRGGARADPAADRAARRRAAQHGLLADPQPARLGPRPHRQLRGALAGPDGSAGASRCDGDLGRFYDAIENPRTDPQRAPDPARRRAALLHGRGPRTDARGPRRRRARRQRRSAARGGFIYEMLLAHEHQHNETMLQLLQMVDGYEPVSVDETVGGRAGRRRAGDGRASRAATYEIGAGRRRLRLRQRAPAPRGRAGGVRDRPHPGHQRRLRRVRRRDRRRAADVLGARRRRLGDARRCGRPRAARPGAAGRPRRLAPGRRVRPLGRQAAADRVRVGGGGDRRRPRARQPRPARLRLAPAPAPTPTAPADCGAVQMLGDVWEWTSLGLRRLPRVRAVSRTPSTPRSSSATATRCCAAAPGRRGAT